MLNLVIASVVLAILLLSYTSTTSTEVSAQRFILPTYRPPPRRPVIIRTVRDTECEHPKWLYQGDIPRAPATGDHPVLPHYIDDVKIDPNRRYARSLDSPSAKRYGRNVGSSSTDDEKEMQDLRNWLLDLHLC
ncbi:unnamed protein product [Pieris macdunnoughi]|uniref:Uncharacterized protein n=1 Tax=Pieris macdunnoughi TaxID=345717 RepID=A0A821X7V0_9NEOP|nr:unnamed protein product [Pieris macdunnoughi]